MKAIRRRADATTPAFSTVYSAPAQAIGSTGGVEVVGYVERVDLVERDLYLRTAQETLVRVTTTPLTALRIRRHRGSMWSETKSVKLEDVRESERAVAKGRQAADGSTLHAHYVLVGDILR
jgi:hypothetical protein